MASLCLVAVAAQAQSYKEYVRKALDAMSMDSTEVAERLFARRCGGASPTFQCNDILPDRPYAGASRKVGKSLGELHHGAERGSPCPAACVWRAKLYMQLGNKEGFGGL